MLISVLIPVYNVEKFVQQAVLSICHQSYQNLEIIIIDDCSTDNTFVLVQQIALQDKRIKLYRNDQNLKLVGTLNKALQYVTGEYVLRMDGDDISTLDRIEKMYDFLQKNPDYVLVGSQINSMNECGEIFGASKLPTSLDEIKRVCIYSSPIAHIWLCKTFLYKELNGYRNILGAEDYDFILRVISAGYKITNLDETLYAVRIREGNTGSSIGIRQIISHDYCIQLYKERLSGGTTTDSYSETDLGSKFERYAKDNKSFSNAYKEFQRALNLYRRRNPLFLFWILSAVTRSKFMGKYLYNRIVYRLKRRY